MWKQNHAKGEAKLIMHRKMLFTCFLLLVSLGMAITQTVVQPVVKIAQNILVHSVDQTFPESLYKSVGTKTFSVQYIRLFADESQKAYIVKAWYFQPGSSTINYQIRIVDEKSKEEFTYDFPGVRNTTYIRLEPILVICPRNSKIYINNQQIPDEVVITSENVNEVGSIILPTGMSDARLTILTKANSGYKEIAQEMSVSKNDEVFIQVVAEMLSTGTYRIDLNNPNIVYPSEGKQGRISMNGSFYKIGAGPSTSSTSQSSTGQSSTVQPFLISSDMVQIGKLPAGEYSILVNIEGLGQFNRKLVVK